MIVNLSKVWVTNVTTQAMLSAQSAPAKSWTGSVDGQVRKYAGGRMRGIGSVGLYNSWKLTLVELTQTQCETLEAWMRQGVTVFVRDSRGQSMYGQFFQIDRGENFGVYPYATYTAAVEVKRVDVVEGV